VIAIDTNVLVRLLSRDNEHQFAIAYKIFAAHEVFIPDTVILETEWVLRHAYDFPKEKITAALILVFGLPNVHVHQAETIASVIDWYKQGLDFADAFHLAGSQHTESIKTFDQHFAKRAVGLSVCPAELL
jgi:predicted nucleic-acid-binding protein